MAANIELKWKKLHSGAELPRYGTPGAACFDLCAALDSDLVLKPGEINIVPTGLACEIPEGFEMQVRGRSGLAAKYGLSLVNGIGTIDADYRGEIRAIVIVHGKENLTVRHGDRIAQAMISPVLTVAHVETQQLSDTVRGEKGFGSTGVSQKV